MGTSIENTAVLHFNQTKHLVREPVRIKRGEEEYRLLAETLEAQLGTQASQLVRQSDELRDLASRLLQAQDEERRRIARELHDSTGSILTLLGLALAEAAQNTPKEAVLLAKLTKECKQLVQQLSIEIRTMSYLLHPPLLDELGLIKAIRAYTEGLSKRSGLKIALVAPADFERLPRETELMIFRTVQECLTNVYRHSGSSRAVIRIEREGETVCFEVQDAGKGISAARQMDTQSQGSGVGIRGMRERVHHFGGQMHIESNGAGTTVFFTFPFPVARNC